MNQTLIAPAKLRGTVRTPGDKSISHRAVLISALANGASTVVGCSNGADVADTIRIVRQLGATVTSFNDQLTIVGPSRGLNAATEPLDCGNSGTTMRLLCGVLASVPGHHVLIGDPSLSNRPMDRVATPLNQMGLRVEGRGSTVRPPLHVTREAGELRATTFTSPVASAQVKSAVILAALQGDAPSEVSELTRTRANTEEMLQRAGIRVDVIDHDDRRTVRVTPGRPNPVAWRVPADPSQGAFFVVAALAHVDAEICVVDLYGGVERIGFLRVLERMGADLSVTTHDSMITVVARSSPLRATTVWSHEIPSVDEVPVLAVAAAAAVGVTRFVDVGELRVKESDRFSAVLTMLELIGVNAYGEGDDLVIEGVGTAEQFRSFSFAGALDHRMVMAAAVAGTVGHGVQITNSQTVTSSYPEFFDHLASLQ